MDPSRHATGGAVRRALKVGGLVLPLVLLAACGDGKDKPASQVAAKVNKEEISVHQINYVMQRQPGLKPEQAEESSRQILERLIDQELAVQKAQELKLDRDPRAVQAIEAARREILSRLYVERAAEAIAKPTAEEIRAYYASKPALFAQRRLYNLQEIAIEVPADKVPALQAQLKGAKSLNEFVEYLKANNIKFNAVQATRAAEQLPMTLVDALHRMKEGQAMLLPTPTGAQAIVLAGSREAPVTEQQARAAIEQFIVNDRKRQLVEQNLKAMREQARVEYVGRFAQAAPAAASAASAAPAAAPTGKAPESRDAAAINKGLSGLK